MAKRINLTTLATEGVGKYPLLTSMVRFLRVTPAASTAQVGAALDLSVYAARYYLNLLVDVGMVKEEKCGRGTSSHWHLLHAGKSSRSRDRGGVAHLLLSEEAVKEINEANVR